MTGYDLNKVFEQTAQHFWTTDQSQIYRALYRMEGNGWVHAETVIQTDNPNKKIYHVSEAGRTELHRWLTTPLPTPPVREGWLGQVFFGGHLENAEIIAVLERYHADLTTDLQAVEAVMAGLNAQYDLSQASRNERFHLLLLEWGIVAQRTQIEHIQLLIDRIKQFPEKDNDDAQGGNHDTIS